MGKSPFLRRDSKKRNTSKPKKLDTKMTIGNDNTPRSSNKV